jgi:F-type H+-transporting ATPase subunit alpha
MVGRVVTLLVSIDGKVQVGFIPNAFGKKSSRSYLSSTSNEPLQTGIKAVDAMIPVVVDNVVVIGDRQTGKSTVCIDTILNQKEFYDAGSLCFVYMLQLDKSVNCSRNR